MDWKSLDFGTYSIAEVLNAVDDPKWQEFRSNLKGLSLSEKYSQLKSWVLEQKHSRKSKIQVTNYVNALRRGGLIPPKEHETT